ncbi:unnamed protein product [Lactuca virosa]|uniref:Uncharacterized protein n=1 Tax=Lactuca virosa TaxID=75947 RepID=A0AAU9LWP2_9ASTR|nr:unnamed protein product [Lactuca virosa]
MNLLLNLPMKNISVIDRLVANFVKWADLGNSTLELVRLGGATYTGHRFPAPVLCGQGSSLLKRLHRKRLDSSSKSGEGPTTWSVASTDADPNLESELSIDSYAHDDAGDHTMASSPP